MKFAAAMTGLALACTACATTASSDGTDMSRAATLKNPDAWVRAAYRNLPTRFVNGEGTVKMQVDINRQGRISACTITATSEDAALDAYACDIARRYARYYPAQDASGNATRDQAALEFNLSFD